MHPLPQAKHNPVKVITLLRPLDSYHMTSRFLDILCELEKASDKGLRFIAWYLLKDSTLP